jgi:hypothetical protein
MSRSAQRVLFVAGALAVAGVVAAAVALSRSTSGNGSAVDTSRLTSGLGANRTTPPPPPRGALVLAREAGTRAVALAISQGPRPQLIATVLASSGGGESGLPLSFRLGAGAGRTLRVRTCGPGCYRARAPANSRPRRVQVLLPGSPVTFRIPAAPTPAGAIVRRASRVFRGLRSLVYLESLRSGPAGGIVTTWRLQAPNSLTYRIHGGAAAVVIGRTRWDRDEPNGPWRRSAQLPALRVPQPTWGDVTRDANLIGTARVDGRAVWVVTFVNPTTPAWFTAWIDRRSYRTLRLRMTAAAHFMFHRYESFDRPLRIRPPT